MNIWTIIVAAGSGSRFGSLKQLEPLGGVRVVDHSVRLFSSLTDGVVVVGPDELGSAGDLGVDFVVGGGQSRSESVRNGLECVPAAAELVLVHDAARPLVSAGLVNRVSAALLAGARAVVPVVPLVDTIRLRDGGTVDRSGLVAAQTPQGFVRSVLTEAHATGRTASDDVALVEDLGVEVEHVEGDSRNLKLTHLIDLKMAEALLAQSSGE